MEIMKRILLKIAVVFALVGALIMFSCEDPRPDCEIYEYGSVIVKNSTGFRIVVDVTEGSSELNDERWINSGGRTTYSRIDAGSVTIWASFDGYDWASERYYLDACEELTYTWYLTGKKSTNDLILEIHRNGELIKTISDFELRKK